MIINGRKPLIFRQLHRRQIRAPIEARTPHTLHAVRYDYAQQCRTAVERGISYGGDGSRNIHADHRRIVFKRLFSDRRNCIGDLDQLLPAVIFCQHAILDHEIHTVVVEQIASVPIYRGVIAGMIQRNSIFTGVIPCPVAARKLAPGILRLVDSALPGLITVVERHPAVRHAGKDGRMLPVRTSVPLHDIAKTSLLEKALYAVCRDITADHLTDQRHICLLCIGIAGASVVLVGHTAPEQLGKDHPREPKALYRSFPAIRPGLSHIRNILCLDRRKPRRDALLAAVIFVDHRSVPGLTDDLHILQLKRPVFQSCGRLLHTQIDIEGIHIVIADISAIGVQRPDLILVSGTACRIFQKCAQTAYPKLICRLIQDFVSCVDP